MCWRSRTRRVRYQRTQLVRNALPWRYQGVLHEFLTCEGSQPPGHLPIAMRRNHDGARRRDPETYRKDAAILENALRTETDPFLASRYTFYLAQSYRDCGEKQKALEKYLARADLGFWQEEVFQSLLQAARIKDELGRPEQEVIDTYLRATNAAPTRAEALHGASRFCRYKNRFEEGYQLAKRGLEIPLPSGALFVEPWIYDYGLLDELAVNGYWSGHHQETLDACEKLLSGGKCPAGQRDRIAANANFARQKLLDGAVPAPAETKADDQPLQPPKIAIYTIALNEAHHVERWAQSAADADYLVVADTGSTDDTVERLTAAGVQVHQIVVRPWRFDDARNASLALAPSDAEICIALDMDEFMFPGWRAKLEAAWKPGTTRLFYNYARGLNEDGSPAVVFLQGKIHSRWGYRWKRIVHEDLQRTEPDERSLDTDAVLMGEVQDLAKDRSRYLPLMEQAHQEDPHDAQLCFWLARELMYAGKKERSAEKYLSCLNIPDWTSRDERAEAMRYLARVQPEMGLEWLQKSIADAGHRRELWLDLAEFYHSKLDWLNLFWACANGIERTRRTGTYLDEPQAWGFRIHDLAALACSHLGLIDQAIRHGTVALELSPEDKRLANNLAYYNSQQAEQQSRAYKEQLAKNGPARTVRGAIEQVVNKDRQLISLETSMASDAAWTVCVIALPGHIHSAALAELAQAAFHGLISLGFKVELATDFGRLSDRCILIGGHLLNAHDCAQAPSTTIVYNSEHVSSFFFNPQAKFYIPHYVDMLRRTVVWDYSADNACALSAMLGRDVLYVPLGYVPQFTRVPKQKEDIDVLFFGSIKPRRTAVLDELTRRGLTTHYAFGVYGLERDRLIARSKIVLNIHANMPGAFEIARVGYLLANSKAVVTEVNTGEKLDDDLVGGFLGVPYDEVADAAFALVHDPARRRRLEQTGFRKFSARCEAAILRNALGENLVIYDQSGAQSTRSLRPRNSYLDAAGPDNDPDLQRSDNSATFPFEPSVAGSTRTAAVGQTHLHEDEGLSGCCP